MENTKELEESLKGSLKEMVLDSIKNAFRIEDVVAYGSKLGHKTPGHYIILCDKPVPGRDGTTKVGEDFVWYNGTSSGLRSRVTSHLRRAKELGSSSAIAVEAITAEEFDVNLKDGTIKGSSVNYFKQIDRKDRSKGRYLNGINFNDYPDYSFKVAFIESEFLSDFIEKLFRVDFGKPVLCQYTKR